MYPVSISTDEHVPLKFLMRKRLSKITKIHPLNFSYIFYILQYLVICKYNFLLLTLNVPLQLDKRTPRGACTIGWGSLL